MHNNLRIELMQWQAHRLRGSKQEKQQERQQGRQQEKYSLVEEKELVELDKNITPCCCLFQPPCLIYFAVFSNLHLLRPPVYLGPKSSDFMKDQLYTRFHLQ